MNSLAFVFYMPNCSFFVMFANKTNRQTSLPLEFALQQKKIIYLQFNMSLTRAPDTQPQLLQTAFHSVKMLISISYSV